jgi:hypothetical protein
LERIGVPPTTHRSEILAERKSKKAKETRYEIRFDVEGRTPFTHWFPVPVGSPSDVEDAIFPVRQGMPTTRRVRGQSVLGEVAYVSKMLANSLPWDEPSAAWFLLTGTHPARPPIEAFRQIDVDRQGHYSVARISLSIDATVLPDEVAREYALIRNQLFRGRSRRAQTRTLEVFRFVNQHRVRDPDISCPDLLREWNRSCEPDWRFGDSNSFCKYWRRARDTIFPQINVHGVNGLSAKDEDA